MLHHGVVSYEFQYKKSAASSWTTAATFETSHDTFNYTYSNLYSSGTSDYQFRVIVGDRAGNKKNSNICTDTSKSIKVADAGKAVNGYNPTSGTYPKATLDTYAGNTTNTAFTTQSGLTWKVWHVDSSKVYLISGAGTTQQLTLTNAIGYNNGVTLLDNICNTCYKANFTGISAKNLKIEDLEAVMEIPKDANYSTQPYPEFTGSAPYIWRQNESASWEDSKNNRSKAYNLTTETRSSGAMRPWWNTYQQVGLPGSIYKDIIGGGYNWLSSRYVYPGGSGYCVFGLQTIRTDRLVGTYSGGAGLLQHSNGDNYGDEEPVRPFVTIPRDSFTWTWDESHENLSIKPI